MRLSTALSWIISYSLLTIPGHQGPTVIGARPQQQLEFLIGKWNYAGEDLNSPFGSGGKTATAFKCEWLPGRYFVVCRENGSIGNDDFAKLEVYGYNPEIQSYTYTSFESGGTSESQLCAIRTRRLSCRGHDRTRKGQLVQTRTVMAPEGTSSDRFTFIFEYSADGRTWSVGGRGQVTRNISSPNSRGQNRNRDTIPVLNPSVRMKR